MTDRKMDLLPGTLEMLVLKAVSLGPKHGYGVLRRIQETSRDVLTVEEGSLYPALHRMEKRGWIESEWGLSEAKRRAKFYRMTKKGTQQLAEKQASWARISTAIGDVLEAGLVCRPLAWVRSSS